VSHELCSIYSFALITNVTNENLAICTAVIVAKFSTAKKIQLQSFSLTDCRGSTYLVSQTDETF